MKNKEKLQRSKSETNLKSPTNNDKPEKTPTDGKPAKTAQPLSRSYDLQSTLSGQDLRHLGARPKSWSPDNLTTRELKEAVKSSPGEFSFEKYRGIVFCDIHKRVQHLIQFVTKVSETRHLFHFYFLGRLFSWVLER